MYKAIDVAQYIIWSETKNRRNVNNLRLHKLLYFVQAQFLVDTGDVCFSEDIVATNAGPVVMSVWHKYKYYAMSSLFAPPREELPAMYEDDMERIDHILKRCAAYSTSDLLYIIFRQEPWYKAWRRWPDHLIMPRDIRTFFTED